MLKMVDLGERSLAETLKMVDLGENFLFLVKLELNVPAGTIFLYLGNSAPTGYSICNGASYNTSTYSQLHANIGSNFGSGNLPSLNGLYLQHNNGASGTNTGWVMKQHYHGTITAGNNNQQCRPGVILVVPTLLETHQHLLLTREQTLHP